MDPVQDFMKMEQRIKKEKFVFLNQLAKKGETLFVGSSLMEQFPINELLMDQGSSQVVYNRGIGGFTTTDMLKAMEEMVFGLEPSRIFINIGTNDISAPDYTLEKLMGNYRRILTQIKERLPEAQVTLMAYYPVNETDKLPEGEWGRHMFDSRNNANIRLANEAAEKLAQELGCRFVNVNAGLTDERGMLKAEYTVEGVHMYANAYRVILENLKPYL